MKFKKLNGGEKNLFMQVYPERLEILWVYLEFLSILTKQVTYK